MPIIQSSSDDDVLFDWGAMKSIETGTCYLVALTDFQIGLLLSVVRYASWRTRWVNAPEDFGLVTDMVKELEHCLMSGCNVDLLIETLSDGFAQIHEDMQTMNTNLETVATNQASGEDLEDDLANLWRQVEQVTLILGGTIAETPIPL